MAVIVGQNSYGSNVEFGDYCLTRAGGEVLLEKLDDNVNVTEQDVALVSAFNLIESKYYYSDWSADNAPQNVKNAQFEVALGIISNDGFRAVGETEVKKLKAGSAEIELVPAAGEQVELFSDYVLALLGKHGSFSAPDTTLSNIVMVY